MDTPVFCRDCKHLLGIRHKPELVADWRCVHPSNIREQFYNLATGDRITIYKQEQLKDVRNIPVMCGPTGTWFEAYTPPNLIDGGFLLPNGQILGKQSSTAQKGMSPSLKARLAALKAEDL